MRKTKSGLSGWQAKVQQVYSDFAEFMAYCETYEIHKQLGFKSIIRCWNKNPLMNGTVVVGSLKQAKK